MGEGLNHEKLDWNQLTEEREQVLASWPTGQEVDLAEAVAFHSKLNPELNFARCLSRAKAAGKTLAQPRAGVADLNSHLELLLFLQDKGEADLLPTTIDSYTRQNRYEEAEKALAESIREGRSLLNGFPAVNHGVASCRRLVEGLSRPLQVRHGTPDARLLAEITLAAGFTAFEGGGISYNIPYAKRVPLEESIRHWQYVDRLVGFYEEQGIPINREPFGPLTGTLVAPCVSHSVAVIEAVLAAKQGVKSITLGYGQCGNVIQDVAALQTLITLAEEYLRAENIYDVEITTVFHQWMGGFPKDEAKAYGVIALGSMTAALGKATKVIVKTTHEALGIPTKEANAQGIRATKQVLNMLQDQVFPENPQLAAEREIILQETRSILNKTLELGEGDWALGAVRAFAAGVIDVPFAPSTFNLGRTMPARDNDGAVRFLQWGNLPFPKEIQDFHRAKLAERGQAERRPPSFQMVIDDIYAVGQGRLVGRPR
ncbi:MAG: methylaspartate mutase subunit E [Limnochordia bacterium]|nr:methylaspartate mutase subunit E [Bacillota bacterium]NLL07490.1 methylaspartate mutase subunit E [Bacillota bacterium]HBG09091.1 methylaspartate mutase subunit E [Bacillota bacterium]